MSRWEVTEQLVGVAGVPDGLEAWRLDQVVDGGDGRRIVGDRSGRRPVRRLVLRSASIVPERFTHAELAGHLAAGTRRRSSARPDHVAHALARAGLVELVCDPTPGVQLACGTWQHWRRTEAGEQLAAVHGRRLHTDDVLDGAIREVAGAVVADVVDPAAHWIAETGQARADLMAVRGRARRLQQGGSLAGLPKSVAARLLVGDTHGLDDDALSRPSARVVLAELGSADQAPRTVLDATGILTHSATATAACHGVPASGSGVAARLLAAAGDQVQILLAAHLEADPDPVAPPTGSGWVFCVENQALVQWAAANHVGAPVIAAATRAGRMLASAAARAGWKVAVTGDFEWGGLVMAAATLDVVPGAIPWRMSVHDYLAAVEAGQTSGDPLTGRVVASPWSPELSREMSRRRQRVTEEDRFEALAQDLVAGRPRRGQVSNAE